MLNVLNVIISGTKTTILEAGLNTYLNLKLTNKNIYKRRKEAGNKRPKRKFHVGSHYHSMIRKTIGM